MRRKDLSMKKFLCILLAIIICITGMPVTALADAPDLGDMGITGLADSDATSDLDDGQAGSNDSDVISSENEGLSNLVAVLDNLDKTPGENNSLSEDSASGNESSDSEKSEQQDKKKDVVTVIIENTTYDKVEIERIEEKIPYDKTATLVDYLENAIEKTDEEADIDKILKVEEIDEINTITELYGLKNGEAGEDSCWIPIINDELTDPEMDIDDYEDGDEFIKKDDVIKVAYSVDGGMDLGLVFEAEELKLYGAPGSFSNGYKEVVGQKDPAGADDPTPDPYSITSESWRFSDSLAPIYKIALEETNHSSGLGNIDNSDTQKLKITFPKAYTYYKGEEFDVHIELTPIDGAEARFPTGAGNPFWGNGTGGAVNSSSTPATSAVQQNDSTTFLSVRPDGSNGKAFMYEVWLTRPGESERVSETTVPFIVGSCFDANMVEYLKIFTNEKDGSGNYKITTSIPNTGFTYHDNTTGGGNYLGWTVTREGSGETDRYIYDKPFYYVLGQGYTDRNSVYGGYTTQNGTGALELRMGYKAYTIEYKVSDDTHSGSESHVGDVTVPPTEYVPVGTSSNPNHPTKPTVTNSSSDRIAYIEITEIFDGDPGITNQASSNKQPVESITDSDGRVLKVGSRVSAEDIEKINMNHNVIATVHLVGEDERWELKYHDGAGNISPQAGLTPNTGNSVTKVAEQLEEIPGSKPENKTSYNKGDVVTGKDGKQYKFLGWFIGDDDGSRISDKEFIFGSTALLEPETHIYARWEPVVEVTFDRNGYGPQNPEKQVLPVGDTATKPNNFVIGNTYNGMIFEGWFENLNDAKPYDFSTQVNQNKHLIAKWRPAAAPASPVPRSPKTGDNLFGISYILYLLLFLFAGCGFRLVLGVNKKNRE